MEPVFGKSWNRLIRRYYWWCVIIVGVANLLTYPFLLREDPEAAARHIWTHLLLQNGFNLLLMIAAEAALRLNSRLQDYIVVGIGSGIPMMVLYLNLYVPAIEIALISPLLVSVLYFRYRLVVFAGTLTLALYELVFWISPSASPDANLIEQNMLGVSIILSVGAASLAIVKKGLLIISEEQESTQRERLQRLQQALIDERLRRDALTGLHNHRHFQERLRELLQRDAAPSAPLLHLALLDVDRFKQINDGFGHRAGDCVLRHVSALLLKEQPQDGLCARYGGEEFAMLFCGTPPEEVARILETLRLRIMEEPLPELGGASVTVSIGCSSLAAGMDGSSWFQRTDEALYEAKRSGRNRVVFAQ